MSHGVGSEHEAGGQVATADTAQIPGKDKDTSDARKDRVRFLRARTGLPLSCMENTCLAPELLTNNIEALVGEVPLPVGVVGPLLLRWGEGIEEVYVPFATTEGALVASANRGATAIAQSGGAFARALEQRMTRTPLFVLPSLKEALQFVGWVESQVPTLRAHARRVSRHAELMHVQPEILGRHVHLHFTYRTGDAAGQNMVTACTSEACRWIASAACPVAGLTIVAFYVEGGLSNDKRLSSRAFSQGRGIGVSVEAILQAAVIRRVLKVEPKRLLDTYRYWMIGLQAAGATGGGTNLANALAAIFAATGQDLASVHESSVGVFCMEQENDDDVYISLTLPNLVIGTVGGGTGLPPQQEYLALMGCAGARKASRLAEIIAVAAMGLDLSLTAAIAANHFADAHERMGRNRPRDDDN